VALLAVYDRLLPHALAAAEHAEERGVALAVVAGLFYSAGIYRSLRADLAGARAALERARATDERAFGPDHPNVAIDVYSLGLVLKDLGDLVGAREALQRALAIDEGAFGRRP
jgi:tetratricopeptide (TPR) repeat protein